MQPNGLPVNSLDLEPAIDRNPVIVASDTPLLEVLSLMTRLRSSCVLPSSTPGAGSDRIGDNLEKSNSPQASLTNDAPQAKEQQNIPLEANLNTAISADGCVLITQASKLIGIFTERDIVKLTAAGTSLAGMKIGDVVKQPLITLRQSDAHDLFTVLSILRQHRIRHLPIIDDLGQVLGVVTHDSIRRVLQPIPLLTRLRDVGDVMTVEVVHASVDASALHLAQIMAEERISCVVITEDVVSQQIVPEEQNLKSKIPVGIITERDIVQFKALELDLSKMQAKDVMSAPLFCLRPSDSLWVAHQEMQRRRVRRMVVVGSHGELQGIVSQTSLLQVLNPADMYGVIEILQRAVERQTSELKSNNEKLRREVAERKRAEEALRQAHDDLKIQVEQRTAELTRANALLKQDIIERQQVEAALRESEAQLRQQATQLEEAFHELQTTQSQLIQTEKMSNLGLLVAGIAHEINNPINFISGNLGYANDYVEDLLNIVELFTKYYPQPVPEVEEELEAVDVHFLIADLRKLLNSMKVGVDRIRDLVLSLKNFSRLDEAQMKAINIHEGLDSTLVILQHQLKASDKRPGIQVIKEYGNLPLVECLGGPLNQVFMNIISNAIDAVESVSFDSSLTPTIRIRTEVLDGDRIAIKIADNGPGILEEARSKLFDAFFTTKPLGKGTGLGLSISYQIIVEKHGGQLHCFSELGKGTEFTIEIPIQQQSEA